VEKNGRLHPARTIAEIIIERDGSRFILCAHARRSLYIVLYPVAVRFVGCGMKRERETRRIASLRTRRASVFVTFGPTSPSLREIASRWSIDRTNYGQIASTHAKLAQGFILLLPNITRTFCSRSIYTSPPSDIPSLMKKSHQPSTRRTRRLAFDYQFSR